LIARSEEKQAAKILQKFFLRKNWVINKKYPEGNYRAAMPFA
jgi:hypothetical protein